MDRYPYPRYTILLDTTHALAHIDVHILHNTFSAYQVFSTVAGDKFSVILTTRQLDITLEFLFLFVFTSAGNLVLLFRV